MEEKQRDWALDIIRIIACLMVICVHVVGTEFYRPRVQTITWGFFNFFCTISRPSVPLFFMISGCLMLGKDHINIKDLWQRKIFRIAVMLVVWVVFYYIVDTGVKYVIREPENALKNIFTAEKKFHLWYLGSLISLYALSPVLIFLAKKMDKSTFRYLIIIFVIFNIFSSTFLKIPNIPDWLRWPFLLFTVEISEEIMFFLLGYYLWDPENEIASRLSNKSLVIIYIATVILATFANHLFAFMLNKPSNLLYKNNSLPVFIETVCIFTLYRRMFLSKNITGNKAKILKLLSRSTLFVYLIHPFFIDRLGKSGYSILHYNVLISVPLTVIAIFIAASLLGMLLEKIPVINRFL